MSNSPNAIQSVSQETAKAWGGKYGKNLRESNAHRNAEEVLKKIESQKRRLRKINSLSLLVRFLNSWAVIGYSCGFRGYVVW